MSRSFVCCVPGCFNRSGALGVRFLIIPAGEPRRQKWRSFLGENVRLSVTSRVCSAHFTAEDFHGMGNLKRTATPSIYPCPVTERRKSMSAVNDDGCVENEHDQNMSELIENVKEELCRVCGNADDSLKSIFENSSLASSCYDVPLVKLLKLYLPLKIQEDDKEPYKICSKCSCTLRQWHELYVTCVAADKVFQDMFCQGKSKGNGQAPVTRVTIEEEKVECPEKQICHIAPYTCKYCYEAFDIKCNLRAHYVSCQERHTLCDQCGKIMPQKLIVAHMSRYHGTKKLCEKCGKCFNPPQLYSHMLSKHSETYTCELCCKIITGSSYRQHIIRHKTGELKTTFKANPVRKGDKIVFACPVCSLTFDDKRSLVMHLNKPNQVKCLVCKVQLNNEKCVHRHSCKKWTCQYCSKSFYSKHSFLEHKRIHTGDNPYKCDMCDLSFRTASLRSAHVITVHKDLSHECTYCSKKFSHASRLRRHMDVHNSVGYVCPLCNKKLKRPQSLRKHIKLHKMGKIKRKIFL